MQDASRQFPPLWLPHGGVAETGPPSNEEVSWSKSVGLVSHHLRLALNHPVPGLVPQPDHRHRVLVGPGLQHVISLRSSGPAQLQVLRL